MSRYNFHQLVYGFTSLDDKDPFDFYANGLRLMEYRNEFCEASGLLRTDFEIHRPMFGETALVLLAIIANQREGLQSKAVDKQVLRACVHAGPDWLMSLIQAPENIYYKATATTARISKGELFTETAFPGISGVLKNVQPTYIHIRSSIDSLRD